MKRKLLLIILALCMVCALALASCDILPNSKNYTVSFDANGGSGEVSSLVGANGTSVKLPKNGFTREGYAFLGWGLSADADATYRENQKYTIGNADVTMYAIWEDQTMYFTVSFDANGGEGTMASYRFEGATTLLPSTAFTRTGYTFTGWAEEKNGSVVYTNGGTFPRPASGYSQTVYAVWKENTYTLTFNSNGGSAVQSISGYYGDAVKVPANPTKAGCTFASWNKPIPATIPAENVTFTALWKGNGTAKYTVTFDANGGTGTMNAQTASEGMLTLSDNLFTRSSYHFIGWSTSTAGNVEYADGSALYLNQNIKLYAIWQTDDETQKVADCISAISALSSSSTATSVASARAKYQALSQTARTQVSNYSELLDAEYQIENKAKISTANSHIQDIVVAAARAYYNQSAVGNVQIHYDQYNNRRHLNPNPEEATAERMLYLDCSSYVNAVYYYVFGKNILSSGTMQTGSYQTNLSGKKGTSEVLFYQSDPSILSYSKSQDMIDDIKLALKPGDVLNYRHDAGLGHVMLYIGDGKFMHCTGVANSTGDPTKSFEKGSEDEYTFGAINIDSWDVVFDPFATPAELEDGRLSTTNRYLFADNINSFCFFRPTDKTSGRYKSSAVTDKAITRWIYDGLTFEKSCNVPYANSVYANDVLEFTVQIQNCAENQLGLINVKQVVPEHTKFVSASNGGVYVASERTIYWQLPSLDALSSEYVTYTVQVDADATGETLTDNGTYVNGLQGNAMIFPIANRQIDAEKMIAAADSLVGTSYSNVIKAAKAVYQKLGMTILSEDSAYTGVSNVLNALFDSSNGKWLTDAPAYKYLVPTLFGGTLVNSYTYSTYADSADTYYQSNLRVRRIMDTFLEVGDLILVHNSSTGKYEGYIYCGKDNIYGISDGKLQKVSIPVSNGSKVLNVQLSTLVGYRRMAILRPSIVV